MKREAIAHPKVVELAAALRAHGVAHADGLADGILERLTNQFTARHAPRGDVGRFSDARIARACGWEGDPGWLISTLVEIGWLDVHAEHRLVLHDWPEHADDATHRKLARARLYFADGTTPNWRRLNPHERAAAEAFYEGTLLDQLALPEADECDPRREVGARRAHVGRTVAASPVPSSSSHNHSRIVPPVRAGEHVDAGAPLRRLNENDRGLDGSRSTSEEVVQRSSVRSLPCSAVAAGKATDSCAQTVAASCAQQTRSAVVAGIASGSAVAPTAGFHGAVARKPKGAVSLSRPVEPTWAPSPDERRPCSAVAAGRDQPRAVASLVYEMQSRLCDQGDPWNLEVIARAMPPEEIERGMFAVVGRRKDGLQMVNAAAYFVTTMKNRARELEIRLDFRGPVRAGVGG